MKSICIEQEHDMLKKSSYISTYFIEFNTDSSTRKTASHSLRGFAINVEQYFIHQ